ncbi:FMN-binding negative transcriptional regulator [uncultured Planktosalinus sp.]|uniref:FMN-binding negative transcriptional regulator n=1 Tax=uncultured Planktosalinus sp. TaxID=1810935 RepID=UPI0030DD10DB
MYPPKHHQENDIKKIIAVIEEYPLGMLVSVLDGKPLVTHIPIIYNHKIQKLVAHIDKYNPQVVTLKDDAEVTVIFRGPDAYISPSIYTTTQLPTWNYIFVHLTGTITLINAPEAAKKTMIAMTEFLEGKEKNYILKPDNKRMDGAVNHIQAFEIDITSWEGKFKLSQDKVLKDQLHAKEALKQQAKKNRDEFIENIYKTD